MRILIRTFGCQMNEYDTELVRSILSKAGFSFTDDELSADIVLLNTCSVRDSAVRKVRGYIHDLYNDRRRKLNKPKKPNKPNRPKEPNQPLIGILGCMATNFREALFEDKNKNLKIDFIAGPDSYKRLPEIIKGCLESCQQKISDVTLSKFETYSDIYPLREGDACPERSPEQREGRSRRVNAWIAVMRGCDNFCTFCVVPYARGRERSRSPESILEEARRAAEEGFCQVTLLGQNVNSYKYEGATFASLLAKVATIDGIKRIRFMSPHPKDFPQDLLEVIAQESKVCKHIHLPLQAGNDRILKMMNRGYSQADYLKLVDKIREICPAATLTTDIIVGFPGETDKEFADTVKIMRTVEFDSAYTFKYSPRPGTIAAKKLADDVSPAKKAERLDKISALQKTISLKRNKSAIGQTFEVLVEQEGTARSKNDFQGRTDGNKLVILPKGEYRQGDFVKVEITDASAYILKGKVL
ncbi:MAG TPA: tRNA (N6-isopentenyl adenosine(37)-C2)-methylthiotransferase MiaB [Candidatus Omnitrophota bacterium]|nr:tRNA (N6-isopentenyl adenosine(37)-C2)-methylthiotransferase MiaB [Candidatus Omnitrophota bacterium]HRZ04113.1 tRNA (N6-isopentenyl adenosine(37)-C2)-methylthiotransferase MiaB [Candidatus Omnitrophota bacterium]